jgi:hypothetical protein
MAAREGSIGGAWNNWRWRRMVVKEEVEDEKEGENQKQVFEAGRIKIKRFKHFEKEGL